MADTEPEETVNGSMLNPSGRWVSLSTARPTLSSPTMARMRASVTSSRAGSGSCGENSPSWILLVLPGSAVKEGARIAACGGGAVLSASGSLPLQGLGQYRPRPTQVLAPPLGRLIDRASCSPRRAMHRGLRQASPAPYAPPERRLALRVETDVASHRLPVDAGVCLPVPS